MFHMDEKQSVGSWYDLDQGILFLFYQYCKPLALSLISQNWMSALGITPYPLRLLLL